MSKGREQTFCSCCERCGSYCCRCTAGPIFYKSVSGNLAGAPSAGDAGGAGNEPRVSLTVQQAWGTDENGIVMDGWPDA